MDQIRIDGIEIYAHHGVTHEEQEVGHRYFADVVLELDLSRPCVTDDLADTVSYSQVGRTVVREASAERFRLLERLADHIAGVILMEFPAVTKVTLRIGKRLPPMRLIAESASVTITRSAAK